MNFYPSVFPEKNFLVNIHKKGGFWGTYPLDSRLVKEPNNSSRNAKLIKHHLNDKILFSSSCPRFTHLGYDPENTVTYFQIVKNALDYPTKRMLVKQGNGISL